ncbi:MAG: hypothetical protein ACFB4I_23005 [Cyanophyceae cyanobacterium]
MSTDQGERSRFEFQLHCRKSVWIGIETRMAKSSHLASAIA